MQTTFPIRRRQSLGFLVSLCAFGALANCAKADIVAAQELPNGRVIVNDPTAYIGSEQNHVNTPWMIVSPDAMQGFANDFTTNAISVVSEDGTNFYAHIETERIDDLFGPLIDKSNVIHFTVDANGIPSKNGEEIAMTKMLYNDEFKNSQLIAVKNDYLYFAPATTKGKYFIFDTNGSKKATIPHHDYRASYQDLSHFCFIRYGEGNVGPEKELRLESQTNPTEFKDITLEGAETNNVALTVTTNNDFYIGSGETSGNIRKGNIDEKTFDPTIIATLPGPISGLSNNGDEVFATTTATNAFYNVTLGQYNVVKDENGNPTPMVPPTQEGLVRVIDNRKKGGKFLYVTATGIYSVD